MPASPADALASLRDGGRYRSHPAEKPVKMRLDTGVTIEIPGPRVLATTYALPRLLERWEIYRSGAALLSRPSGSDAEPIGLDQLALVRDLRESLAALPERQDAGRPYEDLRRFAIYGYTGTVDDYLRRVVAALRRLCPAWRPKAIRPLRGPALTPTERLAAHRARSRAAENASARWWVEGFLAEQAEEVLDAGGRITAALLYELAVQTLAPLAEDQERLDDDDPESPVTRVPGPRVFYAVADQVLGPRHRGAKGAHTYIRRAHR